METESDLDGAGFEGTDPIVIDTPFIADGSTVNPLLDEADSCDAQVWDEFDNVLADTPVLVCASQSQLGVVSVGGDDGCYVDAVYVGAAVGTNDTITCEADEFEEVAARNFSIPNILAESVDPVDDEATAIDIRQEGPQTRDGELIPPCGEGIIQIMANGPLSASKNIEIAFSAGSVAGAELRALGSDTALPIPFAVTLNTGELKRYVVSAPSGGVVTILAVDLGSEPLLPGELTLPFCGDIEPCTVTVTCAPDSLGCEECSTCTAATECGGQPAEGTYTWDVSGGALNTGNTGNSIEVCEDTPTEAGTITVTATDTANENITGSTTVVDTCGDIPGVCSIDVIPDSLLKSHWVALPAFFRIETIGFDFGPLGLKRTVTIDCETDGAVLKAILKGLTIVIPPLGSNTTILWQTGLIWPAALTQSLELESETCTATVSDDLCTASDTFDLDYLSIFGIPLAE